MRRRLFESEEMKKDIIHQGNLGAFSMADFKLTNKIRNPHSAIRISFTLIELLVVIAIIAILAGMLLPALSKAKSIAKSINCVSNQKQFGTAFFMYADSYDGYIPFASYSSNTSPLWCEMLINADILQAPTVSTNLGIWNCPENSEQYTAFSSIIDGNRVSYMGCGWASIDRTTGAYNWTTYPYFLGCKLPRVTKPSSLYAMLDGIHYRFDTWNQTTGSPPFSIGIITAAYRHQRGINMLFADGHVEGMKGPLLNTDANWKIPLN
ncbi:MAG: prepilin-type N-terminal cleavage/methylation domain-containing protein [Victivallales bacterium]|jgi:prepilin-type processing-associated H-X9-DG protein/prepilin-type N-terminal cleavage/methylation domain-containing protein